ncbi:MAG: TolC family protein [Thermoanaerobacteraceae bacterium]|nr:TolC family protein [Thermoanaerobacteraceae bacterium]
MKKLGILTLVALLIMGTITGTTLADPQEREIVELSLEEAINYALEHNPNVRLAKIALQDAEKAYDEAESAADKIKDDPYVPPGLDTKKVEELYPVLAERGYQLAKLGLDYTGRATRLAVEQAYFNVLSAEQKLTVNRATYERALEQLKMAQASFAVGTVAKNDVLGAEVQLAKARADLNTAQNDLDIAYMELNRALGMNLDQPLMLTTELKYEPMEDVDLDQVIAEAAGKDVSLLGKKVDYENKKDAFELTAKFYTPNVYKYRDAKYAMEEALVNYEEAQKDFALRVMEAYKNLKAAEANYKVLIKSVEQAKESLRIAKLRYDVGVATSLEVLQASEALKNQELAAAQALQQYNLVKAQFKHQVFGTTGTVAAGTGMSGISTGMDGTSMNQDSMPSGM